MTDRNLRKALIAIALTGLTLGTIAWFAGRDVLANRIWTAGTVPVVVGLAVSMVRDFMAGRMGVDTVAFVSMSAGRALPTRRRPADASQLGIWSWASYRRPFLFLGAFNNSAGSTLRAIAILPTILRLA